MCAHALISLGCVPRRGAAGSYVTNSFEELPACLPKWLLHFLHFLFRQQGRQEGSGFLHPGLLLVVAILFCEVRSAVSRDWLCIAYSITMVNTGHELGFWIILPVY